MKRDKTKSKSKLYWYFKALQAHKKETFMSLRESIKYWNDYHNKPVYITNSISLWLKYKQRLIKNYKELNL